MYKFGKRSILHYNTLHKDLQLILDELIKIYDVSVIEGVRSEDRQTKLFIEGKSQLDGVVKKSKHQANKDGVSMAVDILPYYKGENAFSGKELDNSRFYFMMGLVKKITIDLIKNKKISHDIRFGLDWDGDNIYNDSNFHDLPHMELISIK